MKLTEWKKELIKANNETLYNGGMDDNNISADIVDQANSYIDSNVEMKAINRQIKLISEIDKALRRIREDTYGYCLDTAEPIGLKRLMARPVAKYTIAAQEKHEKEEKVHADDKMRKKSSKQSSISFLFAKKYIYFYYPFFWIVLLLYLFLK